VRLPDPIPNGLWVLAGVLVVVAAQYRVAWFMWRLMLALRTAAPAEDSGELPRRELVHREVLRRLSVEPARNGSLDRSQYWQVYADVMRDLGGVDGPEGTVPPTN